MRVLVLTNNFNGLYSFRREVIESIKKDGHEVIIAYPLDGKESFFLGMGCAVEDTPFNRKGTNPIKDIGLVLRYKRLLKKCKPDIVLSYTIKPNLYGGIACASRRVPQIANITGLGTAVENGGWLQRITMLLYRAGLKNTRMVFFQNKANMNFCVSHHMVNERYSLIPGSGVNLRFHAFQGYPTEERIKFIFISRLLKEKGIEEYLSAAEHIKKEYSETEFHILGACEEDYKDRLKLLQDENIVIYHGRQPDVRPYIGMCHCTVHPSFYPEGMSNVLLESCAAGRPVITTNRPGCGEIVDDGRTGFLVRERNVDSLIFAIRRFLELPHSQKAMMGRNAREKVEKEFDRQIVVDAYLKEINSLNNN